MCVCGLVSSFTQNSLNWVSLCASALLACNVQGPTAQQRSCMLHYCVCITSCVGLYSLPTLESLHVPCTKTPVHLDHGLYCSKSLNLCIVHCMSCGFCYWLLVCINMLKIGWSWLRGILCTLCFALPHVCVADNHP